MQLVKVSLGKRHVKLGLDKWLVKVASGLGKHPVKAVFFSVQHHELISASRPDRTNCVAGIDCFEPIVAEVHPAYHCPGVRSQVASKEHQVVWFR